MLGTRKRGSQEKTFIGGWKSHLSVAFDFCSKNKNFGGWWGTTNDILLLYDCNMSGVDTQGWGHSTPTCCNKKIELFALTGGGDAKTSCSRHRATL